MSHFYFQSYLFSCQPHAVCQDLREDSLEASAEGALEAGHEHNGEDNCSAAFDWPNGNELFRTSLRADFWDILHVEILLYKCEDCLQHCIFWYGSWRLRTTGNVSPLAQQNISLSQIKSPWTKDTSFHSKNVGSAPYHSSTSWDCSLVL